MITILAIVLFNINNGTIDTLLTATSFTSEVECQKAKSKLTKALDNAPNPENLDRYYVVRCLESKPKAKAE